MNVKLTPELEDLVRERAALRAAIQAGLDDYDAGRYTVINNEEELEAFFRDL